MATESKNASTDAKLVRFVLGIALGTVTLGGWAWLATRLALPRTDEATLPRAAPVKPTDNAFPVMEKAAKAMALPKDEEELAALRKALLDACYDTDVAWPKVRPILAKNRRALDLFWDASLMPAFRATRFSVPMPEGGFRLAPWYDLAKLALIDGRRQLEAKQPAAGLDQLISVLRLSRLMAYDRGTLSEVHQSALLQWRIADDVWTFTGRDALRAAPPAVQARFARHLEFVDRTEAPPATYYLGDRDEAVASAAHDFKLSADADPTTDPDERKGLEIAVGASNWLAGLVQPAYQPEMDRLMARIAHGEWGPAGAFEAPREQKLMASPVVWALHPLSAMQWYGMRVMRPEHLGDLVTRLYLEARFDAMRVDVAAMRYERQYKKRPRVLKALVPGFLPAIPRDPFRPDRPLVYRAGLLYSVGWDRKDDGGRKWANPDDEDPARLVTQGDLKLLVPPE